MSDQVGCRVADRFVVCGSVDVAGEPGDDAGVSGDVGVPTAGLGVGDLVVERGLDVDARGDVVALLADAGAGAGAGIRDELREQ